MSAVDACGLFAPQSVFLPLDDSPASSTAFAHALAVSLIGSAELTIFETSRRNGSRVRSGPGVRRTLQRWGVLGTGPGGVSSPGALGVRVKRVDTRGEDLTTALAQQLRRERPDLLVLGTRARDPSPPWLRNACLQWSDLPPIRLLLVPENRRGFISFRDGTLWLREIVVVHRRKLQRAPALESAEQVARSFAETEVQFRSLSVACSEELPAQCETIVSGVLRESEEARDLKPQELALECADADLVVMPVAAGAARDVVASILSGYVAQLARRCRCPLLLVPSGPQSAGAGLTGSLVDGGAADLHMLG